MNPLRVHLPSLVSRFVARRPSAPGSSQMYSRCEVRPPEMWSSSLTLRGRLQRLSERLVRHAAPWLPEVARPVDRLALAKDEFIDALYDLRSDTTRRLQERIAAARSLRELWHLRSSVFGEVALALSQCEAEQRLAGLNRHFPVRAPRSTLAPLHA